jgi:hypothetical protein
MADDDVTPQPPRTRHRSRGSNRNARVPNSLLRIGDPGRRQSFSESLVHRPWIRGWTDNQAVKHPRKVEISESWVPHTFRTLHEKDRIPRPSRAWAFPRLTPLPFSSHFSSTALTDTKSQSRNNSPTVQHQEPRPSPETDPKSAAKPFSAASLTTCRQAVKAVNPHAAKCTPNRRNTS